LEVPPTLDPTAAGNRLAGYAARFDSVSELLSEKGRTFREVIRPGAFAATLRSSAPILALWNHGRDGRPPLGRTPTTLRLWEDAEGLRFELDLPASAGDVRESVARGDVRGMSFAMRKERDKWGWKDGVAFREIFGLDLVEISPVVTPAYSQTSVGVRSAVVVPEPPAIVHVALARRKLQILDQG
ncbi:MAG: HK97 family phage prohead protease, partial [Ardenticatenales bacterium]